MNRFMLMAALAASLGVTAPKPALAQDAGVVAGTVIILGAVAGAIRGAGAGEGTSENTQYALSGLGEPALSVRQEEFYTAYGSDWQRCCSAGRPDRDRIPQN